MTTPKRAHFSKAFTTEKEVPTMPVSESEMGEPEITRQERSTPPQRSRARKVQIPVYVMPEVRKQLKILCAETGRTQEDLLREALNDLFKKHEKPSVA